MAFKRTLVHEQLRVGIGEIWLNRKPYGGPEACLAKQCLTLFAELIAMECSNLANIKIRACAVEDGAVRMRNRGVCLTPLTMSSRTLSE